MRIVKRLAVWLVILALIFALFVLVMRLIYPVPDLSQRPADLATPVSDTTALGALYSAAQLRDPGLTGVAPLLDGAQALATRLALVDRAQASIDVQYYIWHDDISGILLIDALQRAARRGVRVRLLLDDNGIPGLDPFIAALQAEPGFDVRLFNPSMIRSPKMLGYTFDFGRMNRRMHNKALIVDGAAAVIGGRNIGDEYFKVGDAPFYVDLDVFALGSVVDDTVEMFDAYWNSRSVHAAQTIIAGDGAPDALAARIAEVQTSPGAAPYLAARGESLAQETSAAISQALEWTRVQLVADDPSKGLGEASREDLMIVRLSDILGQIGTRLDLVSAYFVPSRRGTDIFTDLARRGVAVNILTNALDTTDVLMVHSGYTKYRRELLEAGVDLFELKLRGATSEADDQLLPLGLSGASLHAKTFAIDDTRIFIGSFNFDPRSATLNCEMGFLIDSPRMARAISRAFDDRLDAVSYRPSLTPEGSMVWREITGGEPVIYQREPGASFFQQIALTIIGILPVEWLL